MTQKIKTMLAEANGEIETIPAAEAMDLLNDEDVCFIDIRDSAEIERDGKIPGAIHVPRGSLEFQVDPESSMHKQFFLPKRSLSSIERAADALPLRRKG